jgi:glyoxylase-like metal-dependent hydrolase (beta-lactamase superfamily II)
MTAIAFNTDFEPRYGRAEQLSPLVRRVVAANPNPFTFTGTGVYLVGRGEVAVIDTGPSLPAHLDAIEVALEPGERIAHILVTHTHTDHTAGVPDLVRRTGAVTYGHGPHPPAVDHEPLDRISFDGHLTAGERADSERRWAEIPDGMKREGADHTFEPDERVGDGDRIAGPGWTLDVVHTPGHTSNHLCFGLREDGVLFTGDHVMGWATSLIAPPDGDLVDYLSSLRKLLTRPDNRYWPTHGPAIDHPHPYVRSFIEHRHARERQIVSGLAGGPSTIGDLVPGMYAEVDKRLWRAAADSVYAHLLALHRQDRVIADGDPSLTTTWALTG